jgi:hypothetical protein
MDKDNHSDSEIAEILRCRNVAVVGISRDQTKPSYYVAKYLWEHGYHIIPVNPIAQEILGLKCYARLLDIHENVEIVDVFRPSAEVPKVVEEAIAKNAKVVWLQEGIYDAQSEATAAREGIEFVWNRCMMKEHARLFGKKPRIS